MQCPYYVHKALVKLFGLPEEKIRVIQTETGGGFGGKEEYPSLIAGHAALLVMEIRQAGEDDLRPRRRHGRDHQAPSFAHAAQDRGLERRQAAGDGDRFRRSTAAPTARFRRSCFRAARFTPPVLTSVPNVRIHAQRGRDQRAAARRVSADLARRKASSRSSDTSTKLPAASGLDAGRISAPQLRATKAKRPRPAR